VTVVTCPHGGLRVMGGSGGEWRGGEAEWAGEEGVCGCDCCDVLSIRTVRGGG
jgi:hypothetical protein